MKWIKIFANSGLMFFTTLSSIFTVDSLFDLEVSMSKLIWVSIFASAIQIKIEEKYDKLVDSVQTSVAE